MRVRFRLIRRLRIIVNFRHIASIIRPFIRATFSALSALMPPIYNWSPFYGLIRTFNAGLRLRPFIFQARRNSIRAFVSITFKGKRPISRAFKIKLMRINSSKMNLPTFRFLFFQFQIRGSTSNRRIMSTFRTTVLFFRLLPSKVSTFNTTFRIRFRPYLLRFLLGKNSRFFSMFIAQFFNHIRFLFGRMVNVLFRVFRKRIFRFTFRAMRTRFIYREDMRVNHFFKGFTLHLTIFDPFSFPRSVRAINCRSRGRARILNGERGRTTRILTNSTKHLFMGFKGTIRTTSSANRLLSRKFFRLFKNAMSTARANICRSTRSDSTNRSSFKGRSWDHFRIISSKIRPRCVTLCRIPTSNFRGVYFRFFTIVKARGVIKGFGGFPV